MTKLEYILVILLILLSLSFIANFLIKPKIIPEKNWNYKGKVYGTDDVVWDGRYFDSNGDFVNENQPMGVKYSNGGWILEVYNPDGKVHLYKLEKPFDIISNPTYIGDKNEWRNWKKIWKSWG